MTREHIKELLPSNHDDVRLLLDSGVCEIRAYLGGFREMELPRFIERPIQRPVFEYTITAERIFEIGDDAKRVESLLALAYGLTHHSKLYEPDTDKMIKVKKMIDTMLMSVEYVLKQ